MCRKKDYSVTNLKAETLTAKEVTAETACVKNIQANAVKIDGNFMIGDFTCNFVWNDDIGTYVLCGYKE